MNCLIVDDEPIARSILETYVEKTPGLNLVGSLDNALEALAYLKSGHVDLMFLDINMPEFSGVDLMKSLNNPPQIIITTAYAAYGAESYDYEVRDYLLKPISFDRFLKSVQKAENHGGSKKSKSETHDQKHILLKADYMTVNILVDDIRYAQAFGNYVKVHLENETIVVRKTLSKLESEVGHSLLRVNRSYLVSPGYVKGMLKNKIELLDSQILTIGDVYKNEFQKRLRQ